MTQIEEHKMENVDERENIDDIPTRLEMTRSEHSSTSNCKKHGPKMNSGSDPSSSDLSDPSSSDTENKRKKRKDMKKRCKHRKDDLLDPSSSDDSDDSDSSETVIIDVDDAKIINIVKRNRSDYAQI